MRINKLFITIILLSTPVFSFAEIKINEIMYDLSGSDTGREWVEVHNSGTSEVDLSSWKFLESSSASNHSLTLIQGTASLSSGGLAVIVSDPTKFLIDWPGFSGTIFKASFSMNNTGSTLILKDGELNVKDEANYSSDQGALGDGNSLQKNGTNWFVGAPTPGIQNISSGNSSNGTSTESTNTNPSQSSSTNSSAINTSNSTHSSPAPLSDSTPKITFEISAGRDRLTTIGNKLLFQGSVTKSDGISPNSIFYNWSFGDGSVAQGKIVSHQYKFPGEYVVVLNAVSSDLESVSRINVKVISPQIYISKVIGGIEIWNKSSTEINIEGWSLSVSGKKFDFPKDTIIQGNKKVTFPDSIINLLGDKGEMLNPLGDMVGSFDSTKSVESNTFSISTTTQNEIALLEVKLESAKKELALMTSKREVEYVGAPLIVVEPDMKKVAVSESKNVATSTNLSTVFIAEKSSGAISKVFSWPMKGVNWLTRLFVEE